MGEVLCKGCGAQAYHKRFVLTEAVLESPEPYVSKEVVLDAGVFCSAPCVVTYLSRDRRDDG